MYNLSLLVYCQNTEISLGFDFEQTLIEPIYDYHHAAGSWGRGGTSCKENSPLIYLSSDCNMSITRLLYSVIK